MGVPIAVDFVKVSLLRPLTRTRQNSAWIQVACTIGVWRVAEHKSPEAACILTVRNLFWGTIKKIVYKKKINVVG